MKRSLTMMLAVWLGFALVALLVARIHTLPTFNSVRERARPSVRVLLDRHGRVLHVEPPVQSITRFAWTPLNDLSPSLRTQLFTIENLPEKLAQLWLGENDRATALALRMKWTHAQIAEAWLNTAMITERLQGPSAAAHALFDLAPNRLDREQSAILLAFADTPVSRARQRRILKRARALALSENSAKGITFSEARIRRLDLNVRNLPFYKLAPDLIRELTPEPQVVATTLDRDWQWQTLHRLQSHVEAENSGAALLVDNATGEVRVYLGHLEARKASLTPDRVRAPLDSGVRLQPLIYAKALSERTLDARTPLFASDWRKGPKVPARAAVREQRVWPSVQMVEYLGTEHFISWLKAMHVEHLAEPERYGPSVAWGGLRLSLWDLTSAYRAIANAGSWSSIRWRRGTAGPKLRALSEEAAFETLTAIPELSANNWIAAQCDRETTVGRGCVAFSDRYTFAVEATRAPEVVREILDYTHERQRSRAPVRPRELASTVNVQPISRIAFPKKQAHLELPIGRDPTKLFFEITAPRPNQNLYLNGERLGRALPRMAWPAKPGHHQLELRDSQGQVWDSVAFTVKRRSQ